MTPEQAAQTIELLQAIRGVLVLIGIAVTIDMLIRWTKYLEDKE